MLSLFKDLRMTVVKKIVYGYMLDEALMNDTRADMPEDFVAQGDLDSTLNIQTFLNNTIQSIRNRAPKIPLSKEVVTKNPFSVLSMMNYILQFYEQVNRRIQDSLQISENSSVQAQDQPQEQSVNQPLDQLGEQLGGRLDEHPADQLQDQPVNQPAEQPTEHPVEQRQPHRPRMFSLFPNPSLKWRFVKIDDQNLSTVFADTKLQKAQNESKFDFATRRFYFAFDFTKLRIKE